MRTWLRAILNTEGALHDMRAHMAELIDTEDRLSRADTLEKLHHQRGMVEAYRKVLTLLSPPPKK